MPQQHVHTRSPITFKQTSLALALALAALPSWAAHRANPEAYFTQSELRQLDTLSEKALLAPRKGLVFKKLHQEKDRRGVTHARIKQHFGTLPVWGGDLTTHTTPEGRTEVHGKLVQGIEAELPELPSKYTYSASDVIDIAWKAASKPVHGVAPMQKDSAEPIIYLLDGSKPTVAYHVVLSLHGAATGPSKPNMIIDAMTGDILRRWDGATRSKIGTGPGGNGKTGQYEFGSGGLGFLDVTQSGSTCSLLAQDYRTIDAAGTAGDPSMPPVSFPCVRNANRAFGGAFSSLNDTHYAIGKTFEVYQEFLGVKPVPTHLYAFAYVSAWWMLGGVNAVYDNGAIWIGLGGSYLNVQHFPFSAPDILGHEVGHGFTASNSQLVYDKLSGALNEAFSDLSGEVVELRVRGSHDWHIGEELALTTSPVVRFMENPPRDGKSIDHVSQYVETRDVHFNSGIFNKVFYTLGTKPGWNVNKVFQVMATANRFYWTAEPTFDDVACGALRATNDLEFNQSDVVQAFGTVGITCATPPAAQLHPVGGYVLSKSTGTRVSLPNTSVTLSGSRGTFTAQTDSDGLYVKSLPSGTYSVTAAKTGYTFTPIQVTIAKTATAGTWAPTLEGFNSLVIAGRLRDGTQAFGAPNLFLSGKKVSLYKGATLVAQKFTSSSGAYEFASLTPNATYTLKVTEPFWAPASKDIALGTASLVSSLATSPLGGTKVAGVAKNIAGEPVSGLLVQLTPCGEETTVYITQTNEDGGFIFSFTPDAVAQGATCPLDNAILTVLGNGSTTRIVVPNGSTSVALTGKDPL